MSVIHEKAAARFAAHLGDYREEYTLESLPNWKEQSKERQERWKPTDPDALQDQWGSSISNCESPIEQILLAELVFCSTGYGPTPIEIWDDAAPFPPPNDQMFLCPQFKFGPYRVDIAMFMRDFSGNEFRLAIECDGHDFHKTREQAKRDRKRDRYLQLLGWRTLRFTGSEIWADAEACANEVGDFACDLFEADMERTGQMGGEYRIKQLAKAGYHSPFQKLNKDDNG